MLRKIALAVGAALGFAAVAPAWAQPAAGPASDRRLEFQGYWVGVDPLDGGDSRRSFVRLDDGRYAMAGRDTVLTLCDESDRGFISFADGVVQGNVLRSDTLTIACFNSASSVTLRVRYTWLGEDVIAEDTATPAGDPVSRIVLHRTSTANDTLRVPPGRAAEAFAGYWMGVDPVDGGDARRSLVRLAGAIYRLDARDTALTLCDGTDRGYASFDDGVVGDDGRLRSQALTIQCANGLSVVLHLEYELLGRGLMVEYATLPGGAPVSTIVLHKVSR